MKKLTLDNWKEIYPYIQLADYHEYNSNIITMLMWGNKYEVYFKAYPNFTLVYSKLHEGNAIWMMPYCTKEYRKQAIDEMQIISQKESIAFGIHSMTKEFKNWLMDTYPMQFLVWDCYDARDYVYDRMQQQSLVGKKMQKRRNHFNAFMTIYEQRYTYKKLETCDVDNIYAFLKEWQMRKEEDESINVEETGIHLLLDHMDTLPIDGGCIYIDGKLEAFNITSMLAEDTVQIHVEKANREIRGLYIAILKLYLETLPTNVQYVNREDDMGIMELRKAKRDMQPVLTIQKFGSCTQPLKIQKADANWLSQIKKIWLENFEDETEASTNYYFDNFYDETTCYLLISEDELLCMVQLRKMDVMINQNPEQAGFIFGVATNKEYEGCGYMRILMNHVLQEGFQHYSYIYLQAYNYDVYKHFDFTFEYKKARYKIKQDAYLKTVGEFMECYDAETLVDCYTSFTKNRNGYRIRDIDYYNQIFIKDVKFCREQIYIFQIDKITHGYIRMQTQDGERHIRECIYDNVDTLHAMLGALSNSDSNLYMHLDINEEVEGRRKEYITMKLKTKNGYPIPNDPVYISESM